MRRCRTAFAIIATALLCACNASAAEEFAGADGFGLRYKAEVWARQAATPPSVLTLICHAPACGNTGVVTFVRDPRPLVAPGFGPFGPGAVTGAAIDIRVQNLTPGSRILARMPVAPVVLGSTTGYRALYDIEDRALAKTAAAIVLIRLPHATIEARMSALTLTPADIAAFDGLLNGFQLQK